MVSNIIRIVFIALIVLTQRKFIKRHMFQNLFLALMGYRVTTMYKSEF